MQFFLPMIPPTATHQMKQVRVVHGKPFFYDPPSVVEARNKFMSALYRHKPIKPLTGAIMLECKWCFPMTGKHRDGEYKTTRPDTDNLQKLLKDCMTDCGYWGNDAQVACEIVEKFWARIPGIFILCETIVEVKEQGL